MQILLNENLWFEQYQPLLLWLVNTDAGRDLMSIDKGFPKITRIAKNFVQAEYLPGHYITDFRVGAKWANVIRYRWFEFLDMARYFSEQTYAFGFSAVPVVSGGLRGTTTTVYPDPDVETSTVDGFAGDNSSSDWNTVHDAAGNQSKDDGDPTFVETGIDSGGTYRIRRGIFLFDTSAIDAGDTISATTLSLYGNAGTLDQDNDGDDFIAIVTSNPASNTAIANGDYDAVGDAIDNPTEMHDAGARIDLGSFNTSGYNDFAFNATGIGNVTKAGITKLGAREGHDIIDSAYSGSTNTRNRAAIQSADASGTTTDPKLVVVHAAAGASTFIPKVIMF